MVFFIFIWLWHQIWTAPLSNFFFIVDRFTCFVLCLVLWVIILNSYSVVLHLHLTRHSVIIIFTDTIIYRRLIMRVHQKKYSSTSKLVELSIGWQSWPTSLGSQKVLLMLNFWNKKLSRRLLIWMNQSCMVAKLRLHRRGLMSLGWSSVHHAGITRTMATHIDHTEHHTSPHMVMGGLQDSAGQCATGLTSEVRGSSIDSPGNNSTPLYLLLFHLHCFIVVTVAAWMLLPQLSFVTSV